MGARRALVAGALTLGLLTAGCSSGHDLDVDVEGTWVLVSGRTASGALGVPPGSRVSLTFADGSAGGKAPCNDYGSTYDIDGANIDFTGDGGIAQTLAGCDGGLGELESAYISALNRVDSAARDADTLTLGGDEVELQFRSTPPWPRTEVVGHTWWLAAWTDDTGRGHRASWEPGARPYLRLEINGRRGGPVTATSGCRTMKGHWAESGDQPTLARTRWKGDCLHFTDQMRAIESMMSELVVEVRERDGRQELVVMNAHGASGTELVYRR